MQLSVQLLPPLGYCATIHRQKSIGYCVSIPGQREHLSNIPWLSCMLWCKLYIYETNAYYGENYTVDDKNEEIHVSLACAPAFWTPHGEKFLTKI